MPQTQPSEPARAKARAETRPPSEGGRTLPHRLGRYTLFDHVGRGGMADIYLARASTDLGASRLVCIKEVLPRYAKNERFTDMLIAEAKLAARLSHANIASVLDLDRQGGSLYLAMEYVEGFDLRDLLRTCAAFHVPLPIEFSLLLVTETLRGLDYAHRFRDEQDHPIGIVHRDVSPSNVLVSFEGEVKVCDFGIARANEIDAADQAGEVESAIAGKAGYMSPEQARGEALDGRADVFAAGIILWELLAGRRLYKATGGDTLLDVARRAEIPALPSRDLPHEEKLHAIVARALAPQRDDRYASAAAMLRDLSDYAVEAQMVASPIRFGEWLMDHFGRSIVGARRARQRALTAIERGPVATLVPVVVAKEEAAKAPAPRALRTTRSRPKRRQKAARAKAPSEALAAASKAPTRPGFVAYALALLVVLVAVGCMVGR